MSMFNIILIILFLKRKNKYIFVEVLNKLRKFMNNYKKLTFCYKVFDIYFDFQNNYI